MISLLFEGRFKTYLSHNLYLLHSLTSIPLAGAGSTTSLKISTNVGFADCPSIRSTTTVRSSTNPTAAVPPTTMTTTILRNPSSSCLGPRVCSTPPSYLSINTTPFPKMSPSKTLRAPFPPTSPYAGAPWTDSIRSFLSAPGS